MMFRRNSVTSSRDRMTGELTESFDHLRKATDAGTDAAREALAAGARMAQREVPPRVDWALASLTPVIDAAAGLQMASRKSVGKLEKRARKDARHAVAEGNRRTNGAVLALRGDQPSRRWPLAVAALVTGLFAGAAASLVAVRLRENAEQEALLEEEMAAEATFPTPPTNNSAVHKAPATARA